MTENLRRDLEANLEGEVRFDKVSRALYSTDASVYQIEPLGVVIVRSSQDIVQAIKIARRHGCSVTMRGGGTSQAGQAIGAGLQLDTSKYFNKLLEVNPEEKWARVEPGIVLDDLNAQLSPYGLRFAPDISTASRATLGGMIGNNSSGARSILYGKTIDHILELHVVLADGSISHMRPMTQDLLETICTANTLEGSCYRTVRQLANEHRKEILRRYPKILRRVGGYNLDEFISDDRPFNLARLIIGSEGTLGSVVEARINLVPLPKAKAVLTIEFDNLLDALDATPIILNHKPAAVEVMDRFILDHARNSPTLEALRRSILRGDPGALLCVEFYADEVKELPERLKALEHDLAVRGMGTSTSQTIDPSTQARIWHLRESALGLSMAMKGDAKSLSFVEDTAVAPEKLRPYIEQFLSILSRHGTTAGVYAHASVGCLHVRPVVNLKTEEGVHRFEAIANEVADLVLKFGGALSGEHGDGLVRGPFIARMFGPVLYETFKTIKRTFDPVDTFNPGKIVDSPKLTDNLRYGANYQTPNPISFFDYDTYGGFSRAVEMCSGLGVCRKTLNGTMCPSYMATRDEKHSTRGRANILRLTMAGRLDETGLGDTGVYDVLDLCLECRACKTECPVGVDVARFKSEFLADYWQRHGTPLRAQALGHIHEISAFASRVARFINPWLEQPWVRTLNERLLGIDRRRPLPRWAERSLTLQWASRKIPAGDPSVLLFNDTFVNYYHPEVGIAAAEVMESSGIPVTLTSAVCCGRPLISQGLLKKARQRASENTRRLYPQVAAGKKIVFLEPSCLSALKEDVPALLRDEEQRQAQHVAKSCFLFEEFLESALHEGSAHLSLSEGPGQIMLHGHCHQKALGLVTPAQTLLERIPNVTVTDLDAGCCGMAGSFGYARDHFDVSRQIGERRLLPAARTLNSNGVLVAAGVSCRHQVYDFSGVRALHPAELLRSLITLKS